MKHSLRVPPHNDPLRIDCYITQYCPTLSRSYVQKMIDYGSVLLNGVPAKKSSIVEEGDAIEFTLLPPIPSELIPENIPLDILFEDDAILVINKPRGMVVHPGCGNWQGTFVHALLFHCELTHHDTIRPGIVHRLDKETSGILVAAKTPYAHRMLVEAFAERNVIKTYLAIALGKCSSQIVHRNIARHPNKRKQMGISPSGKEAISSIELLGSNDKLSLVSITPYTGRTHQIRLHMQSIGHPILGDPVYGYPSQNKHYAVHTQLLHAYKLSFPHPIRQTKMTLTAPLPEDMRSWCTLLLPDHPFA